MALSLFPFSASSLHQLLSAYYATVMLLGMFIFFLFPVFYGYFIARVSLMFCPMEYSGERNVSFHQKHMHRYRKGSRVRINF